METSSIETIVCLVPNREQNEGSLPTSQSTKQQFIASPINHRFELFLNGKKKKELSWNVKECNTPQLNESSIAEQKRLIQLVLQGYNATCLLISAGDINSLYQQRKMDTERLLNLLHESVSSSKTNLDIEYTYFGITDDTIYDFRKERDISNSTFFEKGQDAFMKRIESVPVIWNKLKRGSKLPFVLTIKITDSVRSIQSRLQIIDVLHPPLPDSTCYHSFSSLLELVHKISSNDYGHLNSDYYVLTDILSRNLAGHDALSVFAYFNDHVVEKDIKDISTCLDLSTSLNHIQVCLLPTPSIYQAIEYKKLKAKYDTLASTVTEVKNEGNVLDERLKVTEQQVMYLECSNNELQQRASPIIHQLKQTLAYEQTVSSLQQFKIKELEISLNHEIEDRQMLIDYERAVLQSQLHTTKRAIDDSQAQLNKLQRDLDDRQSQIFRLEQEKLTQVQLRQQDQQQLMMVNSDTQRLEREIKQSYKLKYEDKFQQLYSEFQRKIKQVERKHEKEIARLKQGFEEDIQLVRETERANHSPEIIEKLRQNLKDMHLKNIDLRNMNAELKYKLKQVVEGTDESRPKRVERRRVASADEEEEEQIESAKRPKRNSNRTSTEGSSIDNLTNEDIVNQAIRNVLGNNDGKLPEGASVIENDNKGKMTNDNKGEVTNDNSVFEPPPAAVTKVTPRRTRRSKKASTVEDSDDEDFAPVRTSRRRNLRNTVVLEDEQSKEVSKDEAVIVANIRKRIRKQ
ncbi:MAG: hypothetical protein EXX96DRAFT_555847 [Benjaminiella poitrasii]|nr:MAG: hypothetical protein EXX96DRAFT_555847 [Benjaminiella poitrasii]